MTAEIHQLPTDAGFEDVQPTEEAVTEAFAPFALAFKTAVYWIIAVSNIAAYTALKEYRRTDLCEGCKQTRITSTMTASAGGCVVREGCGGAMGGILPVRTVRP